MQISSIIQKRLQYLADVYTEKQHALKDAPEGILRGIRHGKDFQYFLRSDSDDKSGTYIRRKDRGLAIRLGQKDYDRRVQKAIKAEAAVLKRPDAFYRSRKILTAEEIYESLPAWEQAVVIPVRKPTEQFVKEWRAQTYTGRPFGPDDPDIYYYKGIRMRSKSEVWIAMLLDTYDIPFLYEKPLKLSDGITVYPDFSTLDVRDCSEVYWEHLGKMDNPKYYRDTVRKIGSYVRSNIFLGHGLIVSQETSYAPLDMKETEEMLCWRYGKKNVHLASKLPM